MNRLRTAALAAVLSLGLPALAADAPKADDVAKQLADGSAVAKNPADWDQLYAQAMPALLAKPEADDATFQQIAFRASRPGYDVERAALGRAMSAKLTGGEISPAAKVLLLRHVGRVGGDETVAAVVSLLADSDANVAESARRALANIPTKAAADALRGAIDKASDPRRRGALVAALAHRRDAADAPLFAKLVAADAEADDAVRLPALAALARTGDASAAPVLAAARDAGSDRAKAAAHDAYLLLADRLVALDQRAAAAKIYREYLFSPQRWRYAGIIGLGVAGSEEDVAKLLNLLADKDPQARGAALTALAGRRDPDTGNQVMARLPKADAAARPWLIRALMAVGDRRAGKVLWESAADGDETVRVLAITGLAQFGDANAVPLLLKSAAAGKAEEQVAARNTLETIPAKGVDDALLGRLAGGDAKERVEAIRAVGARRSPGAVDPLFAAAADADNSIRGEAHKSLAAVAEFDALPRALRLMLDATAENDRDTAAKTVVAVARKSDDVDGRTAAVLAEVKKADGPLKAALLNVAGQLGGPKAYEAVRGAIGSEDEKTHEAGVRALANWPDAAPLPDLLALAGAEKANTLSVLALRGYLRIVGLPGDRKAGETLALYRDAVGVARRPEEKKMILGGLGDVKDARALGVVAKMSGDPLLANEANAAAIKIAKDKWQDDKELAATLMRGILLTSKNEGQRKAAQDVLDKITADQKPK